MISLPNSDGCRVLVVDDQRSTRLALTMVLKQAGYTVLEADSATSALEVFQRERPDVVMLDIEMPQHDGYWAASRIRENEVGNWTPIVFVSGMSMELNLWRGVEAGGDDYLVKPVPPVVLLAKMRSIQRQIEMRRQWLFALQELRHANATLSHLSETDGLTGLLNRRGLDRHIEAAIHQAHQRRKPLTLLLCDVDHFKLYNDTLGHQAGDDCLSAIGDVFRSSCQREGQHAGRYGGEEFALVLSDTPKSGAMTFARALMNLLAAQRLPHPKSSTGDWVTISGGITTCIPDEHTSAQGLIQRADEALYVAKGRGRNRFFSYEMRLDTLQK
ncbi:MAG: diguanylate cyclase [Hydrogenophaga sp.]|nr:diguanylate cyclase [Hydrogenophaga sp.]